MRLSRLMTSTFKLLRDMISTFRAVVNSLAECQFAERGLAGVDEHVVGNVIGIQAEGSEWNMSHKHRPSFGPRGVPMSTSFDDRMC